MKIFAIIPTALLIFSNTLPALAQSSSHTSVVQSNLHRWLLLHGNDVAFFDKGLHALSEYLGATIIAEDSARHTKLEASNASELRQQMLAASDPDQLSVIFANAYDYDVIPFRKKCFLFTKRFRHDDDLCCVTLAEWNDSLTTVAYLMKRFVPKPNSLGIIPFSDKIIQSINPSQVAALQSDGGLEYNELTVVQKQYIQSIGSFAYVQMSFNEMVGLQSISNAATSQKNRYGWFVTQDAKKQPARVFGYGSDTVYPLFSESAGQVANGILSLTVTSNTVSKDETAPDVLENDSNDSKDDKRISILQIAKSLSTETQTYMVAPMLAAKTVTVSGKNYVTPTVLWNGIAAIYGLRVREDSQRQIVMERKHPKVADDINGLRTALLSALPSPFLRSIHVSTEGDNLVMMRGAQPDGAKSDVIQGTHLRVHRQWRLAAIKKLRTIIEPVLAEKKRQNLELSELPDSAQFALANVFMAKAETLREIVVTSIPIYISTPELLVFKGGPYKEKDGTEWFSFSINTRRDNGTMEPYFGFSNRTDLPQVK